MDCSQEPCGGDNGDSICRNCYYSDKEGRQAPARALRARIRLPARPLLRSDVARSPRAPGTTGSGLPAVLRASFGLLTGWGWTELEEAGSPRTAHPARPAPGRRNWRGLRRALPCPGLLGWTPPQTPNHSRLRFASLPFAARTSVRIAVRTASGSVAHVWAISSSSGLGFPEIWEAIEEAARSAPLAGVSP